MFQQPALRPTGVLTQNPERTTGAPKTITHFVPCQMVALQYMDANGTAHEAVVLKVGNKWYLPPNSETWFGGLRELAPWLVKQCEEQLSTQTATAVPKTDSVDLFLKESAE